jgi:hypothetical protein
MRCRVAWQYFLYGNAIYICASVGVVGIIIPGLTVTLSNESCTPSPLRLLSRWAFESAFPCFGQDPSQSAAANVARLYEAHKAD